MAIFPPGFAAWGGKSCPFSRCAHSSFSQAQEGQVAGAVTPRVEDQLPKAQRTLEGLLSCWRRGGEFLHKVPGVQGLRVVSSLLKLSFSHTLLALGCI